MRTFALLAMVALAGCAEYQQDTFAPPSHPLDSSALAYIAVPDDGRYGDQVYSGSGRQTALALLSIVAKHASHTALAEGHQTHDANLAAARTMGAAYVFEPTILHWEDRATEWSGITDKLAMKLAVYDAGTGRALAETLVHAHSAWFTFGGDHPQDLLPESFDRPIAGMY